MEGDAAGGYRWGSRHVLVEQCIALSMTDLARAGFFKIAAQAIVREGGFAVSVEYRFGDRIWLEFAVGSERIRQTAPVHWQDCTFSGLRPWWICPGCGKRVEKLYLPLYALPDLPVRLRFLCRSCHDLTYSQSAHKRWIACRKRTLRLEAKLEESKDGRVYRRPKGMHRRTFQRLVQRCDAALDAEDREFERFWDRHFGRLLSA